MRKSDRRDNGRRMNALKWVYDQTLSDKLEWIHNPTENCQNTFEARDPLHRRVVKMYLLPSDDGNTLFMMYFSRQVRWEYLCIPGPNSHSEAHNTWMRGIAEIIKNKK